MARGRKRNHKRVGYSHPKSQRSSEKARAMEVARERAAQERLDAALREAKGGGGRRG